MATQPKHFAKHIMSRVFHRPLCGQRNWRHVCSRTELTTDTCRRCVARLLREPIGGWTEDQWREKVDEAIKRGSVP